MTVEDRPARTDGESGSDSDEGGRIIPFPPCGRDGLRNTDQRWSFVTEVRWVDGVEGEWLRHQLAGVLQDLLEWARDDMTGDGTHDEGQEGAA